MKDALLVHKMLLPVSHVPAYTDQQLRNAIVLVDITVLEEEIALNVLLDV